MNKKKLWIAGTAVACVAILVAGWFLLLSPRQQKVKDLNEQTSSQQAQNDVSRGKLNILRGRQSQVAAEKPKLPRSPATFRRLPTSRRQY